MGVHKQEAYPEIKRLLDIPQDEPIFILRAQDNAAMQTLDDYGFNAQHDGAEESFLREVEGVAGGFVVWRKQHPTLCKTPD